MKKNKIYIRVELDGRIFEAKRFFTNNDPIRAIIVLYGETKLVAEHIDADWVRNLRPRRTFRSLADELIYRRNRIMARVFGAPTWGA